MSSGITRVKSRCNVIEAIGIALSIRYWRFMKVITLKLSWYGRTMSSWWTVWTPQKDIEQIPRVLFYMGFGASCFILKCTSCCRSCLSLSAIFLLVFPASVIACPGLMCFTWCNYLHSSCGLLCFLMSLFGSSVQFGCLACLLRMIFFCFFLCIFVPGVFLRYYLSWTFYSH